MDRLLCCLYPVFRLPGRRGYRVPRDPFWVYCCLHSLDTASSPIYISTILQRFSFFLQDARREPIQKHDVTLKSIFRYICGKGIKFTRLYCTLQTTNSQLHWYAIRKYSVTTLQWCNNLTSTIYRIKDTNEEMFWKYMYMPGCTILLVAVLHSIYFAELH